MNRIQCEPGDLLLSAMSVIGAYPEIRPFTLYEGKFQFAVGSKGSGPGCFDRPRDVTFGSDGLVYVSDFGNWRVCVWNTICYDTLKLYLSTIKTWSSAAVSCTVCTNLYLFPVTLCTFVQETAASMPQFA